MRVRVRVRVRARVRVGVRVRVRVRVRVGVRVGVGVGVRVRAVCQGRLEASARRGASRGARPHRRCTPPRPRGGARPPPA